jgi:predicted site-specific integrase-resolvase
MDIHAVDGQRIVTLIGADEAGTILGVDRSTITRWAQAGKLAPIAQLFGRTGALLFAREDIEALAVGARTEDVA